MNKKILAILLGMGLVVSFCACNQQPEQTLGTPVIVSEETRKKLSKSKQKIRRIENIITGEVWIMSIQEFLEKFPEKGCKYDAMKKAANIGNLYKKTYKITDCVALDVSSEKSGENGEPPIKENPVGSNGSE